MTECIHTSFSTPTNHGEQPMKSCFERRQDQPTLLEEDYYFNACSAMRLWGCDFSNPAPSPESKEARRAQRGGFNVCIGNRETPSPTGWSSLFHFPVEKLTDHCSHTSFTSMLGVPGFHRSVHRLKEILGHLGWVGLIWQFVTHRVPIAG